MAVEAARRAVRSRIVVAWLVLATPRLAIRSGRDARASALAVSAI